MGPYRSCAALFDNFSLVWFGLAEFDSVSIVFLNLGEDIPKIKILKNEKKNT